ncbi:MAG: flavodoxin family protein [Candidatus Methanomethylophilaceae archaeon]|nr:flavodoxin family protein [Candidatus Methanomethylophilaceae archaeon]
MSIVAIISSPRANSNTGALVDAAIEGAKENGHDVKVFKINAMKDKRGCQACNGCKKAGKCVIKDELSPIYDAIREADGLIVSAPVYFGEACGQYRLFEDRLFGYVNADFSTNLAPGKKAAVFTTAGTAGAEELAAKMGKVLSGFFKIDVIGSMGVITQNAPDYVKTHPEILAQAKEIGKKF